MGNKNITTIIFDFDYTLADSSRGVLSCINFALTKLGFPETSYSESCKTIGLSLKETYAALTGEAPENGERFVQLFIEQAENVMADMTVMFDETPGVIQALKADGNTLGIVSTKFRYRIETILRRENLLHFFDIIIGGEDVNAHKPDPESLQLALDKLGASAGNTLYVGDSLVDAKTAQNLGVQFAAVLSGVTPDEAFKGYPAVQVLVSVRDLPEWIAQEKRNYEGKNQP
jgi:phosphoglycolate phosphatase